MLALSSCISSIRRGRTATSHGEPGGVAVGYNEVSYREDTSLSVGFFECVVAGIGALSTKVGGREGE